MNRAGSFHITQLAIAEMEKAVERCGERHGEHRRGGDQRRPHGAGCSDQMRHQRCHELTGLDSAPFITGDILHVDGGQSAGH